MKLKLFIVIFLAVEIFASMQWLSCANFMGQYSSYDLGLRLIADIHNDQGVPLWETRVFHNKILGTTTDIFDLYIKYWSIPFLANLISPIGVLGFFAGFYYWIQSKKKSIMLWLLVSYLFAAPFLEIFSIIKGAFIIRLILLTLPYILWSLFGISFLTKHKKRGGYFFLTIFLLLSVWYIVVTKQLQNICLQ